MTTPGAPASDPAATNGTRPEADGGLRLEIVAGGQPTDEELAALVVALSALSWRPAEGAGRVEEGWRRAARREALGEPLFVSPADLWGRAPSQ